MSGPKRNPDKLNTIGIVVVGICGAVMVYVTIVALQAFYMGDTADMQANKDFGGMDTTAKGHKADEMRNITEAASNPSGTYRIPIDNAMGLIVRDAEKDPSHLVPALPPSTKPTIEPAFGRPKLLGAPPAPTEGASGAAPAGAGSAAAPAGAGAGSAAAPAGAGSAAAPAGAGAGSAAAPAGAGAGSAHPAAPQTPTGAGAGPAAGASPAKGAAQPTHAGSAAH